MMNKKIITVFVLLVGTVFGAFAPETMPFESGVYNRRTTLAKESAPPIGTPITPNGPLVYNGCDSLYTGARPNMAFVSPNHYLAGPGCVSGHVAPNIHTIVFPNPGSIPTPSELGTDGTTTRKRVTATNRHAVIKQEANPDGTSSDRARQGQTPAMHCDPEKTTFCGENSVSVDDNLAARFGSKVCGDTTSTPGRKIGSTGYYKATSGDHFLTVTHGATADTTNSLLVAGADGAYGAVKGEVPVSSDADAADSLAMTSAQFKQMSYTDHNDASTDVNAPAANSLATSHGTTASWDPTATGVPADIVSKCLHSADIMQNGLKTGHAAGNDQKNINNINNELVATSVVAGVSSVDDSVANAAFGEKDVVFEQGGLYSVLNDPENPGQLRSNGAPFSKRDVMGNYSRKSFNFDAELSEFMYGDASEDSEMEEEPTVYEPRFVEDCPWGDGQVMLARREDSTNTLQLDCGTDVAKKRSNGRMQFNLYWLGRYWWWSKFWRHLLPIPTHFWKRLNNGRGGYYFGFGDGISTLDTDANDNIVALEEDHYDTNRRANSFYNVMKWNILSERNFADQRGLSMEVYAARNFSIFRVTSRAAIRFGDVFVPQVTGGFRGIHRNSRVTRWSPWWWWRWMRRSPVFQFIHNWPIQKAASPRDVVALATYILPPYWDWARSLKYPVFFLGGEDTNIQLISGAGLNYLALQGRSNAIFGEAGFFVGIFSNSGGSFGHICLHQSLDEANKEIMDVCRTRFNCNKDKALAFGLSRSANAAWRFCFNPLNTGVNAYHCKYLVSQFPATHPGDWFHIAYRYYMTWTRTAFGYSEFSGYGYSFEDQFVEFDTLFTGIQLVLNAQVGHYSRILANDLGPHGAILNGDIDTEGVNIGFSFGTHDAIMFSMMTVNFVNELFQYTTQNASVYMWLRGGHNFNGAAVDGHLISAFDGIASGALGSFTGELQTFKRATEALIFAPQGFTPNYSDFPSQFTLPKLMKVEDFAAVEVITGHNKHWRVTLTKIMDHVYNFNESVVYDGPEEDFWIGHADGLDVGGTVLQAHMDTFQINPAKPTGLYHWRVYESFDGSSWNACPENQVPQGRSGFSTPDPRFAFGVDQPFDVAIVEVVNARWSSGLNGPAFAAQFSPGGHAWGIGCETI